MINIFYFILNMSIGGAIAGIIVMLISRIRVIPRRFAFILWAIPFLRLIMPYGIASRFGLQAVISLFTTRTVPITEQNPTFTSSNYLMQPTEYFPMEFENNAFFSFLKIAAIVWVVTAAVMLLTMAVMYTVSIRKIYIESRGERVFYSNMVNSPGVYGIIRPRIALPLYLEKDDISSVMLHEEEHIRRKDNLWRLIGLSIACLHWFNPLIWVFMKSFFKDMELACDESVVKDMDIAQRKKYAHALVELTCRRTLFGSAFGGGGIKKRIEKIISYEKLTIASGIILMIFLIVTFIFLLTGAPV